MILGLRTIVEVVAGRLLVFLFVSARSSSGGYCCFDWFEVRALRESWWLVVPGAEVEVVN